MIYSSDATTVLKAIFILTYRCSVMIVHSHCRLWKLRIILLPILSQRYVDCGLGSKLVSLYCQLKQHNSRRRPVEYIEQLGIWCVHIVSDSHIDFNYTVHAHITQKRNEHGILRLWKFVQLRKNKTTLNITKPKSKIN